MGGGGSRALPAALIAVAILAAASPASAEAVVTAVHLERQGDALELLFKLRGTPRMALSRHGDELWIDLEATRLQIPPRPLFGAETPPLAVLRAIDNPAGHSRLLVEVSGKTDYALARFPHEIVLRLAPAGRVANLAAPLLDRRVPNSDEIHREASAAHTSRVETATNPARDGTPPSATDGSRPERLLGHARVVIDPGHGGYDPGTQDTSGRLREKDLALQISRRLALALEARGVSTDLTRDGDRFLALHERTQYANRAAADLFVSIHLNWSPNPQTSGMEVYYLKNTTDRAALRLAKLENGGRYSAPGEPNLNYILSDLRQNYKAAESASLARMIEAQTVTELARAFNLGVNPLGAKMGPFYVLVGAEMPSVLIECGFLSNRVEAERLASAPYQERLADGITGAVVHYLNADLAMGNL